LSQFAQLFNGKVDDRQFGLAGKIGFILLVPYLGAMPGEGVYRDGCRLIAGFFNAFGRRLADSLNSIIGEPSAEEKNKSSIDLLMDE